MGTFEFATAVEWLAHCATSSDWAPGDQPIVMISYAREDAVYLAKLRKHLDRVLKRVRSGDDGITPFTVWDYARHGSGTELGSHFPSVVAERMWRCRAAVIVFSPDYVGSSYCMDVELPFLLWRMVHHSLRVFLLRLNETVADDEVLETPAVLGPTSRIDLRTIVDDRNPALVERTDGNSEKMFKELERLEPDQAEVRLIAYAKAIARILDGEERVRDEARREATERAAREEEERREAERAALAAEKRRLAAIRAAEAKAKRREEAERVEREAEAKRREEAERVEREAEAKRREQVERVEREAEAKRREEVERVEREAEAKRRKEAERLAREAGAKRWEEARRLARRAEASRLEEVQALKAQERRFVIQHAAETEAKRRENADRVAREAEARRVAAEADANRLEAERAARRARLVRALQVGLPAAVVGIVVVGYTFFSTADGGASKPTLVIASTSGPTERPADGASAPTAADVSSKAVHTTAVKAAPEAGVTTSGAPSFKLTDQLLSSGATPAAPAPNAGSTAAAKSDPGRSPSTEKAATVVAPNVARAVLYEEGKDKATATITEARTTWSTVPDPKVPGSLSLVARVEIPDREIVVTLKMDPNRDASFPASHLIEIRFALPSGFDGKSITNVPGLILKESEQARGDPLRGAGARVSENYFWVALRNGDADRTANMKLLGERGWIDLPLLYETGRRAILTLSKAGTGDAAYAAATASWRRMK